MYQVILLKLSITITIIISSLQKKQQSSIYPHPVGLEWSKIVVGWYNSWNSD